MKTSVFIPAYNEAARIGACLEGLQNQEVKPDEVIVVNNNSTDNTAEIAGKFDGVRVVLETHQGITPARDRGLNEAKYDIIIRTDADSVAPPNWIKTIKEIFEAPENVQAATGPIFFYPNSFFLKKFMLSTIPVEKAMKLIYGYDIMMGPNLAITKSLWENIKDKVCKEDKIDDILQEDIDFSMHAEKFTDIKFKMNMWVASSPRRMITNPHSFFIVYPSKTIGTLTYHRKKFKNEGF